VGYAIGSACFVLVGSLAAPKAPAAQPANAPPADTPSGCDALDEPDLPSASRAADGGGRASRAYWGVGPTPIGYICVIDCAAEPLPLWAYLIPITLAVLLGAWAAFSSKRIRRVFADCRINLLNRYEQHQRSQRGKDG